jgi:aldose 1-epimerase
MSPHDAGRRAWPWPFRATQWFQLADAGNAIALRMRLTLGNTGEESFPFGLGWHPFFPCDSHTQLQFLAQGVWETNDTMIPTRHVASDGRFDFSTARDVGSAVLDNIYTGWTGTAELCHAAAPRVITLRGDNACPYFVAYIPPHHTFLAIEPVTQMTDAFNRAERGDTDTGTRVLAPGESFSCTMEILVRERA